MRQLEKAPVVLCFSGSDPTGASGIAADVAVLNALGCHCCPIITAITSRDTQTIKEHWTLESVLVIEQARAILEDMDVRAIKLGMMGSVANIEAVHTILTDYPQLTVIIDPVLQTADDSPAAMADATKSLLLPQARLAVLNHEQLRLMGLEGDSLQSRAHMVMEAGCDNVFVSGPKVTNGNITNHLFSRNKQAMEFAWPLLQQNYVGAGQTLSASITAYMSHQDQLTDAVEQAQKFTYQALQHGQRLGMGGFIPNRMFWCNKE